MKKFGTRICDCCGKEIDIFHKKRMTADNICCSYECSGLLKSKEPNTRCAVCKKPIHIKPRALKKNKNGICCSDECGNIHRSLFSTGENNPNNKHHKDFDCFYDLTPEGAYILGFIFSDGNIDNNTINIFQHKNYNDILVKMSNIIFSENLVTTKGDKSTLSIHSKELVDYIISLGGIKRGKKCDIVEIPNIPEDKKWSFICGYFDGDGGFKYDYKTPSISITSNSSRMLEQIAFHWGVNYTGKQNIWASGYKALDICGKMYNSCSLHHFKKFTYYLDILNWEPHPNNGWYQDEYFRCKKLSKDAIIPSKTRVTDSGYDVYAITLEKEEQTGLYIADMRIAVEPISGHYFDLIGRSSLPKSGFHFIGGVGVIDRSYVGSIKMYLQKIGDNPLPELPFKCAQLIPRKIIHCEFIEVESLQETERSDGGFGSTTK
jgi:dUTP pyrophosphatase